MEIPLLDSEEEYQGDESTYYHGFGCTSNLEGILDNGALNSPGRREAHPDAVMREQLYEDILRHAGNDFTQYSFSERESVEEYLEENKEDFLSNGQEYTQWLAEENAVPQFEVPDFMGKTLVWVSQDKGVASDYAASGNVPGSENSPGGYFKLNIPEESVLQFGVNGGVPGKIPLEFAEELYIQDATDQEYNHLWGKFLGSKYDISVQSL